MTDAVSLLIVAGLASLALVVGSLSALLDRSSSIRLHSWAESTGGRLRAALMQRSRFRAFCLLLSLAARALFVGFLLQAVVAAIRLGLSHPILATFGAGVGLAAVGEIVNRAAVLRSEAALRVATLPLRVLAVALAPLITALAPLMRVEAASTGDDEDDDATREEIEAFIDVGRREGILEANEEELLRGVVDFADTQVRSVMTPRIDIVCGPIDTPLDELVTLVLDSGHSRIPLYRESIDDIVGVLHVRDLLRVLHLGEGTIESCLQPAHFVPETKSLDQLLAELQERHQEIAVVVDEYGGTEGLVTIEDLLEEIFGEIIDEHDEHEPELEELSDGTWRLDGRVSVERLAELFPSARIDEEEYETVGGLVFGLLGHVPSVGASAEGFGLRFLVESSDRRRAGTLRVGVVDAEEEAADG